MRAALQPTGHISSLSCVAVLLVPWLHDVDVTCGHLCGLAMVSILLGHPKVSQSPLNLLEEKRK